MVTVQLFASYAEALGSQSLQIPFESGGTVADLICGMRLLPGGQSLPPSPRVAVNRKFASPDQIISGQDEIAVIPPVAGG
jgi:molybdopterin synthase catalytic subunit